MEPASFGDQASLVSSCYRYAGTKDSQLWCVYTTGSKREVPGSTSGRFLTIGSSLPLAEVTAAGSLVATGTLTDTPGASSPLLKYFS
jgi:hypothetical protein